MPSLDPYYQPYSVSDREESEEEYHLCSCCNYCDNFKESEMVYSEFFGSWFAKKCVPYHLNQVKNEFDNINDFNNYSNKINKQL